MNRLIELDQLNEVERQAIQETLDKQSEAISLLRELQCLYIDALSIIGRFSRQPNKQLSLMFATAAFHKIRAAYDLTLKANYTSAATLMRLLLFQYLYCVYYWDRREEAKKFRKGPRKTKALEEVRDMRRQLTSAQKKAARETLKRLRREIDQGFYQNALVDLDCLKRQLQLPKSMVKNLKRELRRGYALGPSELLTSLEGQGVFTSEERCGVNKALNTLHRFVHGGMGPTQEVIQWPHPRLWPKYDPEGFRFCARHLLTWGIELAKFLRGKHRKLEKHPEWQAKHDRLLVRWDVLLNSWNSIP